MPTATAVLVTEPAGATYEARPTPATLPKVYIYPAGKFGADVVMVALAEDGLWHLSHICSTPSWGRFDLHERRSEEYTEKFGGFGDGEFYDLVICASADEIPLSTLIAAGLRNPDGSRPVRS